MRVRIVCYEDVGTWILGKFARRLCENLQQQGVAADISKTPDPTADINHHIIYNCYDGQQNSTDTVMITHVDTDRKLWMLRNQMPNVAMAICMSADTLRQLVRDGIPRSKLCYINPAHDQLLTPRKLVIGVTSKVQPTGCKREFIVPQLAQRISPDVFEFTIMGAGWDSIIADMRAKGFQVNYCDHFDHEMYLTLMPQLDYYLYTGQDEGSMGFVDALASGIPTIVTPQGFHLDAHGGITYPFNTIDELERVFLEIAGQRTRRTNAVASWTWPEYARRHALVWRYLLERKDGDQLTHEMERELEALGVARHRGLAALQTGFYMCLWKARRGLHKVKRLMRNHADVQL